MTILDGAENRLVAKHEYTLYHIEMLSPPTLSRELIVPVLINLMGSLSSQDLPVLVVGRRRNRDHFGFCVESIESILEAGQTTGQEPVKTKTNHHISDDGHRFDLKKQKQSNLFAYRLLSFHPLSSVSITMSATLTIVIPGDDVTEKIRQTSKKAPKLGTGLRHHNDKVLVTCAGRLEQRANTYYIKQNVQRYRPHLEDRVIGVVEDRVASDGAGGDIYRVNIGGSHPALLSNLDFEGSTKRNKPNLQTGVLLYARVQITPPSMDPTLSCQLGPHDGGIPRKDWMTNEGTYGELKGGTCKKIPLGLARELLDPRNVVLQELSKSVSFEVCIGVNGWLWVHSPRPEYTILIQNAILNSQVLTEAQVRGMVKSLVETVNRQIEQTED
jgi:exosome complex component RRP40